jgi:Arc-like DNA binding domain
VARQRDEIIKLNLRLPGHLHRRLEREAARAGRSLNTEIIERLLQSFAFDLLRRSAADLVNEGYPKLESHFMDVSRDLIRSMFRMVAEIRLATEQLPSSTLPPEPTEKKK